MQDGIDLSSAIFGSFPRVDLKPGQYFVGIAPHSEVCMHMRCAGEMMLIKMLSRNAAQLFRFDPMRGNYQPFSAAVTTGEAGIYTNAGECYAYGLRVVLPGERGTEG